MCQIYLCEMFEKVFFSASVIDVLRSWDVFAFGGLIRRVSHLILRTCLWDVRKSFFLFRRILDEVSFSVELLLTSLFIRVDVWWEFDSWKWLGLLFFNLLLISHGIPGCRVTCIQVAMGSEVGNWETTSDWNLFKGWLGNVKDWLEIYQTWASREILVRSIDFWGDGGVSNWYFTTNFWFFILWLEIEQRCIEFWVKNYEKIANVFMISGKAK